jgi:hypothetical protein
MASVVFRVWAPTTVSIAAVDRELGAVQGAHATGDCSTQQYQQTIVEVEATWSTGESEVTGVQVRKPWRVFNDLLFVTHSVLPHAATPCRVALPDESLRSLILIR